MDNTGSFGSAIGGGDAIKAAMARRGMGGNQSPMNQVSPAAQTFNPATQPAAPTGGIAMPPQGAGMAPTQPTQPTAPTAPGMPPTNAEGQIIIKALSERLKALTTMGQ